MTEPKTEFEKIKKEVEDNGYLLKRTFGKSPKRGRHEIAKFLKSKYKFKCIAGSKSDELFIYKKGVYRPTGTQIIRKEAEGILKNLATISDLREIADKIKRLSFVERSKTEIRKNLINLKNGIYDLSSKTLKSHDSNLFFISQLPIEYNPKADCHEIKKFLREVLYEEDVETIIEWIGFLLWRDYFLKKAILLVGPTHTGKSTLLRLISTFIGMENISGISLQMIAGNKFACADLYGKHVNIFDDLSFRDVNDNGTFKIATGNGLISAERKFGDRFTFINFAKLMFAANKIPPVKDVDDDAYFDRWLIMRCDNQFKKKDDTILKKITTPEELSGLLNYVLNRLDKILKQKKFCNERPVTEIKDFMQQSSSSIAAFAANELIEGEGSATKEEMYNAYCDYCRKNDLYRESKEKLGRQLQGFVKYVIDCWKDKKRAWGNVVIRGQEDETVKFPTIDEYEGF